MDPRLARALVAWLIDRDTRLGTRVRPQWEQPGGDSPFLIYTQVSDSAVGNCEARTGQVTTRVQIDVWAKDHATGASIASTIRGTGMGTDPAARGLDYFAGDWPDPADGANPVTVQLARRADGGNPDDGAGPTAGTEEGWYRFSADYLIEWERV
jgi:hypothetical protein